MKIKRRKKKKKIDSNINLMMDSGAVSLHNFLGRKFTGKQSGTIIAERRLDTYKYIKEKSYKDFRDEYAKFIKKYERHIDCYINLDVIFRPKETYENQKYLEKKGIKPLPVWHVGVDIKYLHRYLDEGYDYICIGGITPNPTRQMKPILDRLFADVLCDSSGMPKAKYHGLAITGVPQMVRYPWYSVDSTSWLIVSGLGAVFVPRRIGKGKFDYLHSYDHISVSTRAPISRRHYKSKPRIVQKAMFEYIEHCGLEFGKSKFTHVEEDHKLKEDELAWGKTIEKGKYKGKRKIEVVLEPGVSNTRRLRCEANVLYYRNIEGQLPEWPWPFKLEKAKGFQF